MANKVGSDSDVTLGVISQIPHQVNLQTILQFFVVGGVCFVLFYLVFGEGLFSFEVPAGQIMMDRRSAPLLEELYIVPTYIFRVQYTYVWILSTKQFYVAKEMPSSEIQ